MNNVEDFNYLVERAMEHKAYAHMRPVIAKELLHLDILFALEDNGLLDKLTFQGGTALRLCYGGSRLSEDLDFVGGKSFASADVVDIKTCLEHYIGSRYGLEIAVKQPNNMTSTPENDIIKVNKWQIRITTSPEQRDMPKQKIKLEIANVPAYSRVPLSIQSHCDFLPDGYSDMLILTESLEEIMADKIVSLVSCDKYIRHRDIWNLRWLKQKDTSINLEYIQAKIRDYNVTDYPKKLNKLLTLLDKIIRGKAFHDEISRFIPIDVQERTLQKDKFINFLINEISTLLSEVTHVTTNS